MASNEKTAEGAQSPAANGNGNAKSSLKMQRRFYRLDRTDNFYLDGGVNAQLQNKWVFECAWEVCNKGE